jgi:hypothetical protein
MLQRIVSAAVLFLACVGFSIADEIRGVVIKVDGGKITFAKTTFDKANKKVEKGPEQTLPVADNVKVSKGKLNKDTKKMEAGDAVEGGLKNEMFTTIGEKGVPATIITDSDNKKITDIIIAGGKKKAT